MIAEREALDWLTQQPDAVGECDRCHKEPVRLWALPSDLDHEPDAHWLFCDSCFRGIVKGV